MKTSIDDFLQSPTPKSWLEAALQNMPLLLLDHAHCEKKAAATAMGMIYRYGDRPLLLTTMSRLAREELRHFELVLAIIEKRGEAFYHLTPARYATALHRYVTTHEPNKLIDTLIIGAYIEARSCERFRLLAQHVEPDLAIFYKKLYIAEARHFETYLNLAKEYAKEDIEARILYFGQLEAELINQEEDVFRFHSGVPGILYASNSNSSEPSLIKSPIL